MRIAFKHFYGDQTDYDLQLCKPILHLEDSKEIEALESGWAIYDNQWFQIRSTRIDISYYDSKPKHIKDHTVEYVDNFDISKQYFKVYQDFLNIKNFKHYYKLNSDLNRSSQVLIKKNNVIVAFTKMIKYDGGIESQFTVWDYKEPKLSIGKYILDYEVKVAKDLGFKHLYIGPGYDKSSLYKANFKGFEWWSGEEWSKDKNKYLDLCNRDSSIHSLEQLGIIFNEK